MTTKTKKDEQINEEEIKKEKTSKQPIPHEKLNKECNNIDYKKITNEDMIQYILEYAPKDKAWFRQVILDSSKVDKNGKEKTNFLAVKREFCKKYNSSLVPVAKKKETLLNMTKDWE